MLISFYSYIMNIVNHWNSLYWFQILLLNFSHREAGSTWSLFRFNLSIFQIELQYIDFALSWFPLPPMSILTMLPSRYDLGPSIHHHILTPLFNNSIIYIVFIFISLRCVSILHHFIVITFSIVYASIIHYVNYCMNLLTSIFVVLYSWYLIFSCIKNRFLRTKMSGSSGERKKRGKWRREYRERDNWNLGLFEW